MFVNPMENFSQKSLHKKRECLETGFKINEKKRNKNLFVLEGEKRDVSMRILSLKRRKIGYAIMF